jgi:hypothetical protein
MKSLLSLSVAALGLSLSAALASAAVSPFDPNLLSFKPEAASTQLGTYEVDNVNDNDFGGPGRDFVFNSNDTHQLLVIHGFDSAIATIRIWSTDLRPIEVTIKSSTIDQSSLVAADYSALVPLTTPLQPLWQSIAAFPAVGSPGAPTADPTYVEFSVAAPAGTKSLFFDFGSANDTCCSPGFTRISEVQAFAPAVPEPAALGLAAAGLLGVALARRRRA